MAINHQDAQIDGVAGMNYQSYTYKIDWNDLVIRFAKSCAEHYAKASISTQDRVLFIAWVKNLHTILINEIDKKYVDEIAKKVVRLETKYAPKRLNPHEWKTKHAYLYEIDKHYIIYQALIKVVHRCGLKQTPGVSIDLDDVPTPQPPIKT